MNNKVTIYTGTLEKIKGELSLTPAVEKEIKKLILARQKLNEIFEMIENILAREMEEKNIKLIKHDDLKITRILTGRKYSLDPSSDVKAEFVKPVSYMNVNSEAVEEYLDKHKKLPKGIIQKGRSIKVNIELEGGE